MLSTWPSKHILEWLHLPQNLSPWGLFSWTPPPPPPPGPPRVPVSWDYYGVVVCMHVTHLVSLCTQSVSFTHTATLTWMPALACCHTHPMLCRVNYAYIRRLEVKNRGNNGSSYGWNSALECRPRVRRQVVVLFLWSPLSSCVVSKSLNSKQ